MMLSLDSILTQRLKLISSPAPSSPRRAKRCSAFHSTRSSLLFPLLATASPDPFLQNIDEVDQEEEVEGEEIEGSVRAPSNHAPAGSIASATTASFQPRREGGAGSWRGSRRLTQSCRCRAQSLFPTILGRSNGAGGRM